MCAKLVSVKYQWWKDKRDKDLDLKEILFVYLLSHVQTSLVAQTVKHLPAVWEPWVRSQGWENPLEKEMVTHSSTLAWKIPWTEESGGLQSMGSQKVRHDWATSLSSHVQLFRDPVDCSPPDSSVHGTYQVRILEWVATPFSMGSSWPRYQTWVSSIVVRFFTVWATCEAPNPKIQWLNVIYFSLI